MNAHDYYRNTLKEAKKTGSPLACYEVARCLERGFGVRMNKKDAQRWYVRGFEKDGISVIVTRAQSGEPGAQFVLGRMYDKGQGGLLEDDLLAADWYRKAAEQGYAFAQNNVGWMYANGRGLPQHKMLAKEWYRKAAEQGDTVAQNNLKRMNEKKTPTACPLCRSSTSNRSMLTPDFL